MASADWDYQAFSGSSSTGAVSAAPANIFRSRTWWDRWLAVEQDRLADGILGTKWQPGPPPSNATVLRLNQFVAYASSTAIDLGDSRLWEGLEWLESIGILDPGRAAILIEP